MNSQHSGRKPAVKTFAFRCEWRDSTSAPDGFTYAIEKPKLTKEIVRRQRICHDRPSAVKVVPVDFTFWNEIKTRSDQIYSTTREKHPLDLEVVRV